MTARYFADTNILVYAGSRDPLDSRKRERALEIIRLPDIGFSAQVLQEYYDVAYRKGRLEISREEAIASLRALAKRPVVPITADLVIQASFLSQKYVISYWDAAILAAALQLRCEVLYSEDFNSGQIYDGIKVVNPFLDVKEVRT